MDDGVALTGFLVLVLTLIVGLTDSKPLWSNLQYGASMLWEVLRAPIMIPMHFFNVWWNYDHNYKKYLVDKERHQ